MPLWGGISQATSPGFHQGPPPHKGPSGLGSYSSLAGGFSHHTSTIKRLFSLVGRFGQKIRRTPSGPSHIGPELQRFPSNCLFVGWREGGGVFYHWHVRFQRSPNLVDETPHNRLCVNFRCQRKTCQAGSGAIHPDRETSLQHFNE